MSEKKNDDLGQTTAPPSTEFVKEEEVGKAVVELPEENKTVLPGHEGIGVMAGEGVTQPESERLPTIANFPVGEDRPVARRKRSS